MTTRVKSQRGLDPIKPYVPGKSIEEVQREYRLNDVIKMASNENPMGPSPKAVAALKAALGHINSYPDGQSFSLRQALAAHLGAKPEQIAVGNGADGIIMQTCLAYLDEDCEVIVSRSSFPLYDIYTHVMRAKLIKTPLKDYGPDLDAIAKEINARTRLIFFCNPNNPTGTMVTATEVEAFMEKVPDRVIVAFDEAY
jgi:histidinol-phosphate aminotransferase